jgi:site-specific recombinase XerD
MRGWPAAVAHYASVVGATLLAAGVRHAPPPAARGRFRHLHWFRWCAAGGVDPLVATSTQVKAWLDALTTAGAAPATRDRMLATVKALYTHLADIGLAAGNPAALNRRRLGLDTTSTSGTVVLTTAQVKALYTAAATPRRGASTLDTTRATAVVALFTLGLRVSELCGLNRGDLHVTRGRRALRVHGKGGKTRVVYLHKAAEDALMAYLRERDSNADAGTTVARRGVPVDAPLLVTRTGHRYRRQAVWQLLRRLSADTPLHPHALRHFYVTTAVEAGAQLVHVQADVGHSSIDTTEQVYNNAARDPSRSAVDLVGDVLSLEEPAQ